MDKKFLLFDLDGTIVNSQTGVTRAVQYALARRGIDVKDADTLTPFIGPPLRDSYRRHYGFEGPALEAVIADYREYYAKQGVFENTLYPGMDDLLKTQRGQGKTLILATSKPTVYAEQILNHFGLLACFSFVAGATLNGGRDRKQQVIAYALENQGITEKSRAVMIGDKEHDVLGAKALGLDSIGVLYGFGTRAELEAAGATHIAPTVPALAALLLK
ncbi:MAG: HAD hydrolase-like protein [Oscillospiraceae bacterium]|jgi:phosphoglycolate phosphatase|nr:HAD hydrolase-like protein [Oscillospiraceae bacterium]